jgi:adenine-specific DNA methylase
VRPNWRRTASAARRGRIPPGWQEIGAALEAAVTPEEYAALQRATQYAHYTPETIIRGLWRAAERLGFTGGRVLEPGMGTGLFFALLPEALRETCHLTGIEYDPVTARIARLVHPEARVRCEDYTRSNLTGRFDLAIGNPALLRSRGAGRSRHARPRGCGCTTTSSPARSRGCAPAGIALFVTSTGTMDKASTTAREHIAGMADLVGAVRLPEGSMRASAGTEVVIDVLVFQRRATARPRPARPGSTSPRSRRAMRRMMKATTRHDPDSPPGAHPASR